MWAKVLLGSLFLVIALALAGCGSTPTPAPPTAEAAEPAPPTSANPTAVPAAPAVDLTTFQQAWESGPHNNKYDLGKGPNTYCTRCHSPSLWDPKATVGKAPNCFSCKFPFDKEVRNAPENPLIPEDQWKPIGCTTCHSTGQGPEVAIWNNATGSYDLVLTTTALCEKCHTDSLGGTRHKVRLGGGAHSNQIGTTAKRPELCTDCHDPHSGQASCLNCHAEALKADSGKGHDQAHAAVACVACHDASGMDVGLVEEENIWTTGEKSVSRGQETFTALTSHDFKRSVDCDRCHFSDNPWGLWVPTPTPAPAPKATPTP